MSGLKPYSVGGILHFVTNNQVGFTANSFDGRAGRYATEVAKMVGAPIFHVNGDDIEAVLIVTNIAVDYRQRFGKDVVIDIVCYRKYGHNEGDEPMYTQAPMYNIIKTKKTPGNIYADKLVALGVINDTYYPKLKEDFKAMLDQEYDGAKTYTPKAQWLEGAWSGLVRSDSKNSNQSTGVDKDKLLSLGLKLCDIPKDFPINSKLTKLFQQRADDLKNNSPIDWATGEQLAFASLLSENIPIRFTGQDCARGTFSHRHSVLHSQTDYRVYEPLNNLGGPQAKYEVADSNLSEYGVLGFEYGYSLVNPRHLVMWEAQFGDFANGAQIMFDQFISAAETKWLRLSGLVVMLPHGFEGQGPEHSSARLERFLQLAADDNMQIAYPTAPASLFHLLRRQIHRDTRKPLIIMTPKSLLRHKLAVSDLNEMGTGTNFKPILDEVDARISADKVKKIIFCTGKVYYDLFEKRNEKGINDTAIVRFEQLYPFDIDTATNLLKKYKGAVDFVWCQEEPRNMGAWTFIRDYLTSALEKASINKSITYIGRESAASPATGYLYLHNKQQESLVKQALNIGDK
jgi:2-oxoglutarate dehydrogenase E1 component